MNFSYLRREPGFYRRVFTLALPVVLQNLITTSLGFMDTFMVGLAVSNALVALSGALLSQYQGFADVGMGRGAIVIGLAAVIIGEAVFGRIFHNFALKMTSVSLGAIIYYIVIQLVLTLGFDANLLKLLSASVVAVFLAVPYWKSKYFAKPAAKKAQKEDAKNA